MVELYAFQALRTLIKLKWVFFYQVISVGLYILFILFFNLTVLWGQTKTPYNGLSTLSLCPKMVLTLVLLGEDIFRMELGQ
jgi:hypothetical protein